jgi:hypothetical protein
MFAVGVWLVLPNDVQADVFSDVPEARHYKLLYTFQIPLKGGYKTKLPTYQTDNSATMSGPFARVAYYLSLQPKNGKRQFVYLSMDAFTQNPKHMGIPTGVHNLVFQQPVQRMNVVSNVAGIKNATGLNTGNIEFWSTNYGVANTAGVPNASDTTYDTGDQRSSSGSYGSMQIHDHALGQTLFAYNGWGSLTRTCETGIGNNTTKGTNGVVHKDWTFRVNCGDYTVRTIQVLVQKGEVALTHPLPRQVIQRQKNNKAVVLIQGTTRSTPDSIEARVVSLQGGKTTVWKTIVSQPSKPSFSGSLEVDAGWYTLQVRSKKNGKVTTAAEVTPFGVGEVLIIAGQSNSANSGKPRLSAKDPRVSNYGAGLWVPARDPMRIATGGGGSPWPVLGDLLADLWDVPIGILSVGWGGTSVTQWQPNHSKQLYPRLRRALAVVGKNGARAVLWHQGESDSAGKMSTTDYARLLNNVIAESRKDAGWTIPWYIAGVSYLPSSTTAAKKAIRQAQDQVVAGHPQNFAGPTTDDMIGTKWRHDRVHFNEAGLREHARRWFHILRFPPCSPYPQKGDECVQEPASEPVTEPLSDLSSEPSPEPAKEPLSDAGHELFTPDTPITPDKQPDTGVVETGSPDSGNSDKKQPTREAFTADGFEYIPPTETTPKDKGSTPGACGCNAAGNDGVLWWFFALLCLGGVVRKRGG